MHIDGERRPMEVASREELRRLYAAPKERAVRKQIARLDAHCRSFIALSPFVVLATSDHERRLDASPRGGAPGFVRVTSHGALLIPDAPGNNRLDSLENIVDTGRVALLFVVPGVDETLRVNGRAALSTDPALIAACSDAKRAPKVVVRVAVEEAFLHCAKAFMRSRLWDPATKVERSCLPTIGQMINDQTGIEGLHETQEEMLKRYQADL
jgi:PPOX class probable FMN-dependent enzyme